MDINITDADRMEMHRLGKSALDYEGVIHGKAVSGAGELMRIANEAEKRELKGEFMVGMTMGAYYTEKRATTALVILANYINRRETEQVA